MATMNLVAAEAYPITEQAVCIIVSNYHFTRESELPNLPLNKKDADDLEEMFASELNFTVKRGNNLNQEQLMHFLESIISEQCFVLLVFILSHGNPSGFYTTSGEFVTYSSCSFSQLKHETSATSYSIYKPRVFVIQMSEISRTHNGRETPSGGDVMPFTVNQEPHYLIVYSTDTLTHVNQRDSTFIQIFIDCMRQYVKTQHMLEIFNICMRHAEQSKLRTSSTLKKSLYLTEMPSHEPSLSVGSGRNSTSVYSYQTSPGSRRSLPQQAMYSSGSEHSLECSVKPLKMLYKTMEAQQIGRIVKTTETKGHQKLSQLIIQENAEERVIDQTPKLGMYFMKKDVFKGLCLIIDNDSYVNDTATTTIITRHNRYEVVQLANIFEQMFGFHIECFTNINISAMNILFNNIDTFLNPSALIVILLSKHSKNKYPGIFDCSGIALSKRDILQNFNPEKFQSSNERFPKIVIIHSVATANNQPLLKEDIAVPIDCICAKIISSDPLGNSKLLELITLLQNTVEHLDIEEVFYRVASVIDENLGKKLVLPVRTKDFTSQSYMEKGRILMSKLAIQYKFWNEIRIDTITAMCEKRDDSAFTVDTPITINHVGTLNTFISLDVTICSSMNHNIRQLREVREELLQVRETSQEIYHLKELKYLASLNLNCLQGNEHGSFVYKQNIKKIIHNLTMESENTKLFLFGERKETEL